MLAGQYELGSAAQVCARLTPIACRLKRTNVPGSIHPRAAPYRRYESSRMPVIEKR